MFILDSSSGYGHRSTRERPMGVDSVVVSCLQEVGHRKTVEVLENIPDWETFYRDYVRRNRALTTAASCW